MSITNDAQIVFRDMPMPPTINQAYAGNGVRYKSVVYKHFDKSVEYWYYKNIKKVKEVKSSMLPMQMRVIFVFKFRKFSILTKDGKMKRLDTSNRIKIIEDAFSNLIGIDDRYFIDVVGMKRIGEDTVDVYTQYYLEDVFNEKP